MRPDRKRASLLARCSDKDQRSAMWALLPHVRASELSDWREREVWREAAERWRVEGNRDPKAAWQYYYTVVTALGLQQDVQCRHCHQLGHTEHNCPRPGKYCPVCYSLPHRRPQDEPCACGEYYEEDWERR